MRVLEVALIYGACFALVEVGARRMRLPASATRRFTHLVFGVSAAFLWVFLSFREMVLLGLISAVGLAISRRYHWLRLHDVRPGWGEIYFPLAGSLVALVTPVPYIFSVSMCVLAIGDVVAGEVGRSFAVRKTINDKSIGGSLALLLTAFLIAFIPEPTVTGVLRGLIVAPAATLAELLGTKGIDNLLVPATCAACLWLLGPH